MFKIKVDFKFMIIFMMSFIISYIQGDGIANIFFYMFAVMLILSIVFSYTYYKKIDIKVIIEDRELYTNENINIRVVIKNNSNIYIPYLSMYSSNIKGSKPKKNLAFTIMLHEKEEKVLKKNFTFYRRGFYEISRFNVEIKDFFGIITIYRTIDTEDKIIVNPKLFNIENSSKVILQNMDEGEALGHNTKEDNYLIKEMKKYCVGDRIKDINWKVSAKINELYVKKFESIKDNQFSIIIDMNRKNYDIDPQGYMEEKLIESALSIIRYLQRENITCNVYLNGEYLENYEVRHERDFQHLYYSIMLKDSIGSKDIKDIFISHPLRSGQIIFISKLTRDLVQNIIIKPESQCRITIYFCYCEDNLTEISNEFSVDLFSMEEIFKEEHLYESM